MSTWEQGAGMLHINSFVPSTHYCFLSSYFVPTSLGGTMVLWYVNPTYLFPYGIFSVCIEFNKPKTQSHQGVTSSGACEVEEV